MAASIHPSDPGRWMAHLALLGALLLAVPASAATREATARTAVGAGMTMVGIAMVPITTEYMISSGDEGTPYMVAAVPTLLIPGIPTLVIGAVQVASGPGAVKDPNVLPTYNRAIAGQNLCTPYLVVGGMVGAITLGIASLSWARDRDEGAPSFITPMLGMAIFAGGVYLAVDGDNAARDLWGRGEDFDSRPGDIMIGGGVTCLAMGTGVLTALTPSLRLASEGGDNELAPVVISTVTGITYMAMGLSLLVTGAERRAQSYQTTEVHTPSKRRARIDGIVPTFDPDVGTAGLAIAGRF
jgi:hypothetical protein